MTSATRHTTKSDETRASILEAAREVFVADGYEGASIRKVAQRAGITHGTIYLHFRDKDDLLYQLSEEQFRLLLERLRALPRTLDAVARLRAGLAAYAHFGFEFPNHYEVMYAIRPTHLARGSAGRFGPMAEQVFGFLYDALREAAERGMLRSKDPDMDTTCLIGAVHGVIELYRVAVLSDAGAPGVATRTIELAIDGMARRVTERPARHDHEQGEAG